MTQEVNGILALLNEEDRETVILEKFDFKKEKTSLSVDGIQFALHLGLSVQAFEDFAE